MAANMELAKQRGLSDETIEKINHIHDYLERTIDQLTLDSDLYAFADAVGEYEFELQELWGFSKDSRYHTWTPRVYKRRRELQYLGAVYRCQETGKSRMVTEQDLTDGSLFGVGNGFIDFGGVVRVVGKLEMIN
jgi:hypothetical protein